MFDGDEQPYTAYNVPRIRVSDEDLIMSQNEYDKRLRKREDTSASWEKKLSKYTIDDIDKDVFETYLSNAKKVERITFDNDDPESVLNKLELTDGNNLLNAGAALFVSSGMNELAIAKFATDERITFTDIRRYKGSILELIDKGERYIIDAMDWRAEKTGRERIEIPEVPVKAIHEAITNAFAHRIVSSGQAVEIVVFKSTIQISSPGQFPAGKTPEDFFSGNERPIRRNELIVDTLYYSKNMENFATGLKLIKNLCDDARVKVEFKGDEYYFTVVFHRHCGEEWAWSSRNILLNDALSANGTQSGTQNGTQDDMDKAIINAIRNNNKITMDNIAESIGLSRRTVARRIKELNNVKYIGSGYSGHWKIDD